MSWINCGLDDRWKSPRVRGILLHPAKHMSWINCGLDQKWRSPRVSGILLHPAKPMAWINCGLDQSLDHITPQRPADENRQARQESGCTRPASRRCQLWMRETSQAGEWLLTSRFAEMSVMDERNEPGRRAVARVPLRGDVVYG